jgi:hypothetical protein
VVQASDLTGYQGMEPGESDSVPVQGVMGYIGVASATGFQLSESCQISPAAMGAPGEPANPGPPFTPAIPPSPPLALQLSIENATQPVSVPPGGVQHANYVEIYAIDTEAAEDKKLDDQSEMNAVLTWAESLYPAPPPEP